jgi:small subunit ribosomal protein S5
MKEEKEQLDEQELEVEEIQFKEEVISIRRVAKVVKGGKNLSFSVLVAVGDENGRVGIGKGKAREVPLAIKKAIEKAKKNLITVPIYKNTIPHFVIGHYGAGLVILRPASEGTGVIAGSAVRAIVRLAGIKDVLTKSVGSNNPFSMANATMEALKKLKSPEEVAEMRGKKLEEIRG